MMSKLTRLSGMVLFLLPLCAVAQNPPKCAKGQQPFGERCVSQRMSDYITCVEASGANHQEITEEVNEVANKQLSGEAKGSGRGAIISGSGSVALSSNSEKELVKKIQQKWYSDAMKHCAIGLEPPTPIRVTVHHGNGAGAQVKQHSEGDNSPNSVTFGNNSPITITTPPCILGKPRITDGPDAYKGVCTEDLAVWAIREADVIQGMADRCKYDGSPKGLAESGDSFTDVMWRFDWKFKDCCAARVKQLRNEVVNRLGPSYVDEREQQSWDMLFMDAKFPPGPNQAPRQIDCLQVQDYAPYLRKLGRQLKRRVTSRVPPKPLHFEETQLPATLALCKACEFGLGVTINTESPIAGGYIVAEFIPAPEAYVSDIGRIVILGYTPVDNEPLEKYLKAFPSRTSTRGLLTVDIPEDVFGPDKPIHLTVFAPYEFKVDKVTLFDE
ncbi:MAG TPA: hypothetical protein VFO46_14740 [Candidatus Sulfotelmatobacter sp.]|nr:hypothetical protein [Candidatus Sulfotelmatobacter sp.]